MREGKDSERNVYRKRVYNDRDVRLIKGHLIGEREKHMGEAKNQVLQKIWTLFPQRKHPKKW